MHGFLKFIFGIKLYMFRTDPLSIISSFFHCSVLILLASCMTFTIAVCTVKKTADDGQRICPKHVEFYSKNKFEKSVHLVGFIIRISRCMATWTSKVKRGCAFELFGTFNKLHTERHTTAHHSTPYSSCRQYKTFHCVSKTVIWPAANSRPLASDQQFIG